MSFSIGLVGKHKAHVQLARLAMGLVELCCLPLLP